MSNQNKQKLITKRLEFGMTQKRLADFIDVSVTRYQNYERGRRELPIDVARKIGQVFKMDWWQLYEK